MRHRLHTSMVRLLPHGKTAQNCTFLRIIRRTSLTCVRHGSPVTVHSAKPSFEHRSRVSRHPGNDIHSGLNGIFVRTVPVADLFPMLVRRRKQSLHWKPTLTGMHGIQRLADPSGTRLQPVQRQSAVSNVAQLLSDLASAKRFLPFS